MTSGTQQGSPDTTLLSWYGLVSERIVTRSPQIQQMLRGTIGYTYRRNSIPTHIRRRTAIDLPQNERRSPTSLGAGERGLPGSLQQPVPSRHRDAGRKKRASA